MAIINEVEAGEEITVQGIVGTGCRAVDSEVSVASVVTARREVVQVRGAHRITGTPGEEQMEKTTRLG